MIRSFLDARTADLFHNRNTSRVRKILQDVQKRAFHKLDILNSASQLKDLKSPPGNRLEGLKGDLAGFYSIRVNQQWRIIFRWDGQNPSDVALIDYHK